jgi:hypothetical protein
MFSNWNECYYCIRFNIYTFSFPRIAAAGGNARRRQECHPGGPRSTLLSLSPFNIWKRPAFPAGATQSWSCPLLRFNQILERVADLFPEKENWTNGKIWVTQTWWALVRKCDRQTFFGWFFLFSPTFLSGSLHCQNDKERPANKSR